MDFCGLFSNAWYKAMTPQNITASFKVTGICPYNRSSIQLGGVDKKSFSTFNPANLVAESGLKYIPFYSPTSKPRCTPNGIERNEAVLHHSPYVNSENSGSNFEADDSSLEVSSVSKFPHEKGTVAARQSTTISKFLVQPLPPSALPTKHVKSSGKVLTSRENLKLLEEKQREKEEKEMRKNEKRKQQEEKKKQRIERLQKGTNYKDCISINCTTESCHCFAGTGKIHIAKKVRFVKNEQGKVTPSNGETSLQTMKTLTRAKRGKSCTFNLNSLVGHQYYRTLSIITIMNSLLR